ncbi:MAG: OmpA family protein [Proteobacteria bacterium]|nr:OmpA family protein [Pseudomonadota bacterium]
MTSARSILLACTALTAFAGVAMPAPQAAASSNLVVAQGAPPPAQPGQPEEKKKEQPGKPPAARPPAPPAAHPPGPPPAAHPPAPPPAAHPPAPPPAAKPPAPPPPAVQRPAPPPPPAVQHPAAPPPPAVHRPEAPPPAAHPKPAAPPPPPAAQPKPVAPPPPAAQPKPVAPPPPAAQPNSATPPPPADAQPNAAPHGRPGTTPPGAATRPGAPPPPAAHTQPGAPPAAQPAPAPGAPPPAAQNAPAPNQPPNSIAGRAIQAARPAAAPPPPPTQARPASDFIRRDNQAPTRGVEDLRRERHEIREGNRTIITEGDRTIVREGDRFFIRHNEADRFAVNARDVRVMQRGDETVSVIVRPDGTQIVTTTDSNGRLLRRVRRDRGGQEIVIIDNRYSGPRQNIFVNVPPPRWRGPEDRYILDADRASRDAIFTIFEAPPIQEIDRRYTLEEVRYSEPLRAYMPRVDLDVHFDTGSWQLTPDQIDRLAEIADGINRAVSRNPREVFLIEGHTDAVGSAEDNLSLSDRRAEAVAVALTQQFQVPPENLVTQGYGEQYPKVQTDGPSRENRRVAIRRITPLIDRQANR